MNFKHLIIFISLSFIVIGCMPKEKIDVNNPLVASLIYPKKAKQGDVTDINVKITNRGLSPITIINIEISKPTTTIHYKGTEFLEALHHKFRKGKTFNMKYFLNKKLAKRMEHVVPEVHKLKTVIYPGTTRIYTLKAITQDINNDLYKNNISISYLNLDKEWYNKIYVYKGTEKPNEKTVVREFYKVEDKLPSKLEGSLVASSDLGKSEYKKINFQIKLEGWNLNKNKVEVEDSIFLKEKNKWLYSANEESYIIDKDNKKTVITKVNMSKPFIKAILLGKVKVYVSNKDYKYLKEEVKKYKLTLNENYFEGNLTLKQLYDFFDEIFAKGYAIHKHGEVLKVK
jgi:hypothetical protein